MIYLCFYQSSDFIKDIISFYQPLHTAHTSAPAFQIFIYSLTSDKDSLYANPIKVMYVHLLIQAAIVTRNSEQGIQELF